MVKETLKAILVVAFIIGYFLGMRMIKEQQRQRDHDLRLRIQALERAGY